MNTLATTIEQSKHLLELGLSPDSADMEFCYIDEFNSGLQVKSDINVEVDRRLDVMFGVTHIPAWSLAALLEVMKEYGVDLSSLFNGFRCICSTYDTELYDNPIDAAYEMVCWLLEQKILTFNNNEKD